MLDLSPSIRSKIRINSVEQCNAQQRFLRRKKITERERIIGRGVEEVKDMWGCVIWVSRGILDRRERRWRRRKRDDGSNGWDS